MGHATAIGARKPVPTHIGNNVGPARARSPQPWVNVRASSTATASMQKLRMLSASMLGAATRLLSSIPTGAPEIHAILRERYGRQKAIAAYPTMSLAAPLRYGFCISLTSFLFSLSVSGIESEYSKRSLVRNRSIRFRSIAAEKRLRHSTARDCCAADSSVGRLLTRAVLCRFRVITVHHTY